MIKSKGFNRELPNLSVFLLKTESSSAQQRFTAIWMTHRGTGRPNTPHLVPQGDSFIRKGEVVVGTNLTEKQGRMALDASVYVDESGYTQFNREFLLNSFPPFESSDTGYDYRNQ